MTPYALAIFDFDGTLADSGQLMGQAIIDAADRFGYRRLSADEAQALRGQDSRLVMRTLGVRLWQLPRIARYLRQVAASQAERIALFPGVDAMLRDLAAAHVRVAVVSSNAEATIRQVLGAPLASLVSDFECGAAVFGKASRFTRVVARAGVERSRAVAIGDEARDIEAAVRAGIPSGAVAWGYATRERLVSCRPTHLFDTVDDVIATLVFDRR